MSDEKKPYIDNSGFKEFIEHERDKKKKKPVDDTPIDLLPFIEFEMSRINKITQLFSKLKQHQLYPHMDGLIRSERKKNLLIRKKVFEKVTKEDSCFMKNFEMIVRETF